MAWRVEKTLKNEVEVKSGQKREKKICETWRKLSTGWVKKISKQQNSLISLLSEESVRRE